MTIRKRCLDILSIITKRQLTAVAKSDALTSLSHNKRRAARDGIAPNPSQPPTLKKSLRGAKTRGASALPSHFRRYDHRLVLLHLFFKNTPPHKTSASDTIATDSHHDALSRISQLLGHHSFRARVGNVGECLYECNFPRKCDCAAYCTVKD